MVPGTLGMELVQMEVFILERDCCSIVHDMFKGIHEPRWP
jgi:hypothetical protein